MTEENTGVQATQTSFTIVETIAERGSAGITELANDLGTSKSTIHNHVQTLVERGYLIQDGTEYRLGLRFLTLGDLARRKHGLYHAARQEVDELVDAIGERGQVMVEEDARGIYVYQVKSDQGVQTDSHTGTTVDLHATSVGKSYLAFLPEDGRESLLDRIELQPQTANTIVDREEFEAELDGIRERGYAFNDEERITGMRAVGAPILSDSDEVLGALSISGPTTRLNGEWYREEVPERVQQAARVIGIKATYN